MSMVKFLFILVSIIILFFNLWDCVIDLIYILSLIYHYKLHFNLFAWSLIFIFFVL